MIQEWNYAHDADLTIGETHVSKTAKILLICLLVGLFILSILAIYFRAYIYDFIVNPSIELSESSIQLEVHSKFNPDEYIINKDEGYTYEVINSEINTDELSTYTVTYVSQNKVRENSIDLTVNVVDTTGPVIELETELLTLTRGEETENFNASKYLKSLTDNYCNREDIVIDFTTDIDWSKDSVQIIYLAKDTNNNETTKTMNIAVFADKEAIIEEYKKQQAEEEAKRREEERKKLAESQNNNSNAGNSSNSGNSSSNNSNSDKKSNKTTEAPKKETKPYINGVHNITVKVGSSPSDIYAKLLSGVSGSGTISVDASSVNPTVAGKYTATFTSSDGVTKTCTVTVKE